MQVPIRTTALALVVAAILALPLCWRLGATIEADALAARPAQQTDVQIAGAVNRSAP